MLTARLCSFTRRVYLLAMVTLTGGAFLMPVLNRLFLILYAVPTTYLLVTGLRRYTLIFYSVYVLRLKDVFYMYVDLLDKFPWICMCFRTRCKRVKKLGKRCFFLFVFAVCNWLVDLFCCNIISPYRLYYLHAVWHVCIAIVAYQICVIFAYFHAADKLANSELRPVLKLWPREDLGMLGVPFVAVESEAKNRHFVSV